MSADLQGFVREFDVVSLSEKASYPVSSGACHCIAISPDNTQLAAGTEGGFINIFQVGNGLFQVDKLLQWRNRTLCLSWNKNGEFLAAGSVNEIVIWKMETGTILHTLKLPRRLKSVPVIVWCLVFTEDDDVASGDSSGKLSIWNIHNGTCVQSFTDHHADILALALSEDKQGIYTTGVDTKIQLYKRVYFTRKEKVEWIRSGNFKFHSHDVNAIAVCEDDKIFTGGVDSYLVASKLYPLIFQRYLPLPENKCVSVCENARCVLLRYQKHLEVWRLPASTATDLFDSAPTKLIEMHSIDGQTILSASAPSHAQMAAYSTNTTVRLLKLDLSVDQLQVRSLQLNGLELKKAQHVVFSKDGKTLVVADSNNLIQVFSMSNLSSNYSIEFGKTKEFLNDRITFLSVSFDGRYIAATGTRGQITIWKDGENMKKPPVYKYPVTALVFNSCAEKPLLFAAYSDFFFIEYSIDGFGYTKFTKNARMDLVTQHLAQDNFPVLNISFDDKDENIFTLQKVSAICAVNKQLLTYHSNDNKRDDGSPNKKRAKLDVSLEMGNQNENSHTPNQGKSKEMKKRLNGPNYRFENAREFILTKKQMDLTKNLSKTRGLNVFRKYENVLYFGGFDEEEMLSVEIASTSALNKLPPVLKTKQFGRG
ncbi:U3 small nucleolar RNA-associated protein 4 homolog isoform X2 [Nilaparvata lugens]|nr:U3 small nucleolar RNA-associated protein 4 homolog isoform X2 [Nilaparvata lugens]